MGGKEQLSPLQTLQHFLSLIEETCSPPTVQGNGHLKVSSSINQCYKPAKAL